MDHEQSYTIGILSHLTAIPVDTIRYYTEINLLHPKLNGSYRYYSNEDIYVLYNIRSLREAGFSLSEIKEMLSADKEETWQMFLKDRIRENRQKILRAQNELEYMEGLLKETELCQKTQERIQERKHVSFAYIDSSEAVQYSDNLLQTWVNAIPFAQPHATWNAETGEKQAEGFAMFPEYSAYVDQQYALFACDHALYSYRITDDILMAFQETRKKMEEYARMHGFTLDSLMHCFILQAHIEGEKPSFMVQILTAVKE